MVKNKKMIAVLVGNTMQFYDFTIYAFMATQISKEFFNFDKDFLSYLAVFCVFAGGYLTRPFGAVLFGYIGDRVGRGKVLSITIMFSALTTFLIGIIPGYQLIGFVSPVVLVALRLAQGLAVSGEEGGAVVLLFEEGSFKYKGLIGSIVLSSVLLGVLLGMIVCLITGQMASNGLIGSWGWRLPFILSFPLGVLGIYLRGIFVNSSQFELARNEGLVIKNPTSHLFKAHIWTVLYGVSIVSIYSVMTSVLIVHLPFFLEARLHYSHESALLVLMFGISLIIILTPMFGKLCDKFNPVRIHAQFSLLTALISPVLFYYLPLEGSFFTIISIGIFSIITAVISSTLFSILVGRFPFGVRCSGVSLAFNLSVTIFSSSTPVMLLFLENYLGSDRIIGFYVSCIAILGLITGQFFQNSSNVKYFNEAHHEKPIYDLV